MWDYLRETPTRSEGGLIFGIALLGNLLAMITAVLVLTTLGVDIKSALTEEEVLGLIQAPWKVILFAFLEEVGFRLPLLAASDLPPKKQPKIMAVMIVGLSTAFALPHGGWPHLMIQGIAGVTYSLVFLKFGGLRGNPFSALMIVTALHALHNLVGLAIYIWL